MACRHRRVRGRLLILGVIALVHCPPDKIAEVVRALLGRPEPPRRNEPPGYVVLPLPPVPDKPPELEGREDTSADTRSA